MMIVSQKNILHILMQIICMVGQWVTIFVSADLIKWLNQKEIGGFYINFVSEKSLHEHISELDTEYPNELHGLDNNYPLALEKLEISCGIMVDMLFIT